MFESLAVEELHHEEVAALVFVDVVNNADVRVVQRGGRARFAAETFERVGIARGVVRQELQRDEAAELGVFSTVDHAHTAATQLLLRCDSGRSSGQSRRNSLCAMVGAQLAIVNASRRAISGRALVQ